MKRQLTYAFFLLFLSFSVKAQFWNGRTKEQAWGVQVGMTLRLGTHTTLVGLKIQGYYRYRFVQINAGDQIRFVGLNLGKRRDYFAQRINTGIVLLAGKRNSHPNFILTGLNHQSKYDFGLAYNYLWYFDDIGTTQKAGGFALHIKQFSLVTENDIFAGLGKDRFRTSYAGIFYHNGRFNFGINTYLWTGETANASLQKPNKLYSVPYKDLSANPFGKTSAGIFSFSVDYLSFYHNVLSLSMGIDDEHIRNILQNKFIHDQNFVPKKIRNTSPNYPMLDKSGKPVVSEEDKIRPAKFYFQLGINRSLTY